MGLLEDIMKTLDRIPGWKRMQELPSEVEDLRNRVADLEAKLNGKSPGDVCKFCGERGVRLANSRPMTGGQIIEQRWKCEKCERTEYRNLRT